MMREEARQPAGAKVQPWNSPVADRFESECRHGLSDPMWCNICSQDLAHQGATAAKGHEFPWTKRA